MADSVSVTVTMTQDESSVLTAWAKIQSTTVNDLISKYGCNNAIIQAINNQIETTGISNSSSDVTECCDISVVQMAVDQKYTSSKSIPASLVTALEAR